MCSGMCRGPNFTFENSHLRKKLVISFICSAPKGNKPCLHGDSDPDMDPDRLYSWSQIKVPVYHLF